MVLCLKIAFILANGTDPDGKPHYATFHLGLHCFQSTCLPLSRIEKGFMRQSTLNKAITQWRSQNAEKDAHIKGRLLDQWRSQNAKKVAHIKGRLLDQKVFLFNCIPFQNGNFS